MKSFTKYIIEQSSKYEFVCGQCFKYTFEWNLEHIPSKEQVKKGAKETHKVVHGLVTNALDKTFAHAWIEDKGMVYDNNIGNKGWPIKKYYKAFNPQKTKKYTSIEAIQNMFKHRNHGPWHKL